MKETLIIDVSRQELFFRETVERADQMSTFNVFQLEIELKFIILEVNRVMNRVNTSCQLGRLQQGRDTN